MDLKEYKSGTFTNQFGYRSFHPELLNREWMVSQPELVTLLETANIRLGELNGYFSEYAQGERSCTEQPY
jgi:hypothetical protein